MSIIVEFVGAGGAGKSHVCSELFKIEQKEGNHDAIIANHYKVSFIQLVGYSLSNPHTVIQILLFVGKLRGQSMIKKAARFIEIMIYLIRRDYLFPNSKIILFDHGMMQMLRVLERKSKGAVAVHKLDKIYQKLFFSELDKLVVVDADNEKVIERRISRDKIRFPDQESVIAEMGRISDSMKKTHRDAEFVKKECGVEVFTYFNNSDEGLGNVYDFIKS